MESTTATSPSSSAAEETENRLYQASLILEWNLYEDLLRRHRLAVANLQHLAEEAAALRDENALLRAANDDLKRRIVSRLLSATRSSSNPSVSPPFPSPIAGNRTRDQTSSFAALQSADRRRNSDRSSLPKSIAVRSTGFSKIDRLHHQNSDANLSAMEHKIVTMNRKRLTEMQKEEAETGMRSVEVDAYYQGTRKTELCNKWQETGFCPYKDDCQFAHGLAEMRPVLRHPRYKTEVCRMVVAGERCPYGHRCHFRHSLLGPQDS